MYICNYRNIILQSSHIPVPKKNQATSSFPAQSSTANIPGAMADEAWNASPTRWTCAGAAPRGKRWENVGKTWGKGGKRWEIHGKSMGNLWEVGEKWMEHIPNTYRHWKKSSTSMDTCFLHRKAGQPEVKPQESTTESVDTKHKMCGPFWGLHFDPSPFEDNFVWKVVKAPRSQLVHHSPSKELFLGVTLW